VLTSDITSDITNALQKAHQRPATLLTKRESSKRDAAITDAHYREGASHSSKRDTTRKPLNREINPPRKDWLRSQHLIDIAAHQQEGAK
jgi:hypothetical protein